MQLTTTFSVLAAALSFAGSSSAWAKDADGKWVANNNWYTLSYKGKNTQVHESCTYQGTNNVHNEGDMCAYWTNGSGGKFVGKCQYYAINGANGMGYFLGCNA